jgi:hypothetical protein
VLVLTRLSAVIFRTLGGLIKFGASIMVLWVSIGGQYSTVVISPSSTVKGTFKLILSR